MKNLLMTQNDIASHDDDDNGIIKKKEEREPGKRRKQERRDRVADSSRVVAEQRGLA